MEHWPQLHFTDLLSENHDEHIGVTVEISYIQDEVMLHFDTRIVVDA